MILRSLAPALALVAGIAAPALAQVAASDAVAPAPAKPERKICRTVDTTGTIMNGTRICHTKAEWKDIDGRDGLSSGVGDPRGHSGSFGGRMGG